MPDTGQRFGLGFSISRDPGLTGGPRSEGAFGWLGFFNTVYWVDPEEQLVAIIMTQLYPNNGSQLTDKFEVLSSTAQSSTSCPLSHNSQLASGFGLSLGGVRGAHAPLCS